MKEIVSKELQLLRIEKGLSLAQASQKIGVDITTLCAYENSKRNMSIDVIVKIINGYDEDIVIFFKKCIAKLQK